MEKILGKVIVDPEHRSLTGETLLGSAHAGQEIGFVAFSQAVSFVHILNCAKAEAVVALYTHFSQSPPRAVPPKLHGNILTASMVPQSTL